MIIFNLQCSIFNSEALLRAGDGRGCYSPCNYIVNKRIILKKKMCMNESGSERAYDNIAVGAFENKFSMHHNNITILLEDYSFIHQKIKR